MSVEEENKRVVIEYVEAFNRLDIDRLRELFASDALIYGVLGWGDVETAIPIWRELKAAFDLKLELVGLIAEGDTVAARYLERGTSVGPFRGGEVTGTSFEVVAMEWFEIRDGKIQRRWGARDNASQMRQMGLALK